MDPYAYLEKSAAINFGSLRKVLSALHSGGKASIAEANINHANSMIKNYQGNKGMQWRVDRANNTLAKNQPKFDQYTKEFDDYASTLTPGKRKALEYGKGATSFAYDIPKLLINAPSSRAGFFGSMGLYTGAGLLGLEVDPYTRAGQVHGYTNAKDIASQAGQAGAMQSAQDMLTGFDQLSFKDRLKLARNPGVISQNVSPRYTAPNEGGLNFGALALGQQGFLDDVIRKNVSSEINNFKM